MLRRLARAASSAAWSLCDVPDQSVVTGDGIEWIFGEDFFVRGILGPFIAHDGTSAVYAATLSYLHCGDTRIYFAPRFHIVKVPLMAAVKSDCCREPCTCAEVNPDAGDLVMKMFLTHVVGDTTIPEFAVPADVQMRFDDAIEKAIPPADFEAGFVECNAEEMHFVKGSSWTIQMPLTSMSTMTSRKYLLFNVRALHVLT
ncbi:unnamed protein product [Peniophora sp. CBMAI 1063]|nr:unnamed protein product [Peniophora sp. CBMAI 1063]